MYILYIIKMICKHSLHRFHVDKNRHLEKFVVQNGYSWDFGSTLRIIGLSHERSLTLYSKVLLDLQTTSFEIP